MSNVENIFPANDFKIVADNASKELNSGIIIGYDKDGDLTIFGGGLINGRQPTAKDWLWIVQTFKHKLINGDYN